MYTKYRIPERKARGDKDVAHSFLSQFRDDRQNWAKVKWDENELTQFMALFIDIDAGLNALRKRRFVFVTRPDPSTLMIH